MLNFIRWLLVVPAAIGGWCLALVLGILAFSGLENLCMSELSYDRSVSSCGPWLQPAITTFGASLAALFVVTFTSLVAPSNRTLVAWTAYLSGAAVATWIFLQDQDGFALPFGGALLAGFAATVFVQTWQSKSVFERSRYGELRLR